MLVILTSVAYKVLDKIIPLLPYPATKMTVAFIPTAADLYTEKSWLESDRNKLVELGFNVEDVDIKNYSKPELQERLQNKNIIFVAGGTTTYLLEKAQQGGFDKVVKDLVSKGTIYIGSSAGSVLAGPNIEIDLLYDHRKIGKELSNYEGLNLVRFVVLPHADNPKYASIINEIEKRFENKYKLRRLNDNQTIVIRNGQADTI